LLAVGFGLSYSSFTYALASAPAAISLERLRELLARTKKATGTSHFPKLAESERAVQYVVNVTNTGNMDADDVVLGFIAPPGAGTNGLPLRTLFGFERVHVKAGETVSVYLYPSLTEFAATAIDGERHPLSGDYEVSFGVVETSSSGMGHAVARLSARAAL
jgi:hypothetical protein